MYLIVSYKFTLLNRYYSWDFLLHFLFSSFLKHLFRSSLCNALVKCSNIVDESEILLNTLIASLLSTFSTYEVTSLSSEQNCSLALTRISALTEKGLLTKLSTQQLLANLISSYTVLSDQKGYQNLYLNSRYPVYDAVRQYFFIWFIVCNFIHLSNFLFNLFSVYLSIALIYLSLPILLFFTSTIRSNQFPILPLFSYFLFDFLALNHLSSLHFTSYNFWHLCSLPFYYTYNTTSHSV